MDLGEQMKSRSAWSLAIAGTLVSGPLHAQTTVADFYKGKEISLFIGYSPGGAYDAYARLVAKHLPKHVPGRPAAVPKNMPGAGSLVLARHIYASAPKDGTVIGVIARGVAFGPMLGIQGADFDPLKFNWLGSTNDEVSICAFWHTTGISDWKALKEKPFAIGGSGPTSDNEQYPRIMNSVLGTKIKIVTGYPGGNEVVLAMERGELDGRCSWSWGSVKSGHPHWIKDNKINVVMQFGLAKHADLPHVLLIVDLAQSEEDRQVLRAVFARQTMAWPFVTTPDVPKERLAMLRAAFMATMADPEFLADAANAKLEVSPVPGERIAELIAEVYKTPDKVVQRIRALLN